MKKLERELKRQLKRNVWSLMWWEINFRKWSSCMCKITLKRKTKKIFTHARSATSLSSKTAQRSYTTSAPVLMFTTRNAWLSMFAHRLNRVDFLSCALTCSAWDLSQDRQTSKLSFSRPNWSGGLVMSGRWSGIDSLAITSSAPLITVTTIVFAKRI